MSEFAARPLTTADAERGADVPLADWWSRVGAWKAARGDKGGTRDRGRVGYASAVRRDWLARTLLIQLAGVALTGGILTLLDYLEPLLEGRRHAVHDMVARTPVREAHRQDKRP